MCENTFFIFNLGKSDIFSDVVIANLNFFIISDTLITNIKQTSAPKDGKQKDNLL